MNNNPEHQMAHEVAKERLQEVVNKLPKDVIPVALIFIQEGGSGFIPMLSTDAMVKSAQSIIIGLATKLMAGKKPDVEFVAKDKFKLTAELLHQLPNNAVFARGTIANSPDGLYMTSDPKAQGRELLWLARRGDGYPDWAIYVHWSDRGDEFVLTQGDKVHKDDVRKLVDCNDEAFKLYRR